MVKENCSKLGSALADKIAWQVGNVQAVMRASQKRSKALNQIFEFVSTITHTRKTLV
jgi:hypothetical protein